MATVTDDLHTRAVNWILSRDTGLSSEAIWGHMMGGTEIRYESWCHPHDPDDLGRCLRLLEKIPEWKPRVPEMAARSEAWAALVPEWDALARSMADEVGINWEKKRSAPRTYELMRSALSRATSPKE